MSHAQPAYPPQQPFPGAAGYAPPPTNGVGLAGFIVSLLGMFGTCGLLSPVGFILSLIGIFKEPKGFAIAGLILGLFGSLWLGAVALVVGVASVVAVAAAIIAGAGLGGVVESAAEAFELRSAIETYRTDHAGAMPGALTDLPGVDAEKLNDPWGRPYSYTIKPDGRSFTIHSDGKDGKPGTSDDITFDF